MSNPINPPLTFKEKVAYGLGDSASNFLYQFLGFFGLNYYTDIFGLGPAAVGTMILMARMLDAVVDPMIGITADRTQTRWGKFRPYLLWGALPYGIIGYVTFMNPAIPAGGKLLYAYVTYSLTWFVYSAINIPYSALMGVMSPSSAERKSISSVRFTCAFIATFFIITYLVPLKNWLGHGNDAEGIRWTILLFSVASVILFLLCFAGTRERVASPRAGTKLLTELRDLSRNPSWIVLFILGLVLLSSIATRNAAMVYYFKYVAGAESKFSLFTGWGFGAFILGSALTKYFLRLGESRNVLVGLYIVVGALQTAFYFVDPHHFAAIQALNIASNFFAGPQPALLWAMYSDCAAFGEWKFGRRSTGLVFSSAVFSQKAGAAFGGAIAGWLLAYFGFVANRPQTPAAAHGILLLFTIIPGALAILSGVLVLLYPLRDEVMKAVERDLERRTPAPAV